MTIPAARPVGCQSRSIIAFKALVTLRSRRLPNPAGRRRRPAGLAPDQANHVAVDGDAHVEPSAPDRQRAEFCGIGGQFVQQQRQIGGGPAADIAVVAADRDPAAPRIGVENPADEREERRSRPFPASVD